jgi:hypothetical protein
VSSRRGSFHWLDARQPKGLGHPFIPLRQPRRPRGRRHPRLRRDVRQIQAFCRPASPVRTAAAPDRPFFEPLFFRGGLRSCLFCMPHRRGFPQFVVQTRGRTNRGARPQPDRYRGLIPPRTACAGCGGGSHRLADPVASAVSSLPHHQAHHSACTRHFCLPQSAAGRSAVLLLLRRGLMCAAVGQGVHGKAMARGRGSSEPQPSQSLYGVRCHPGTS